MGAQRFAGLPLIVLSLAALLIAYQIELARGPLYSPIFPGAEAVTTLHRVLGDQTPHPTGTSANRAVAQRILEELKQHGVTASTQVTTQCNANSDCVRIENIVAHIPGQRADSLLLSAHYDSVPASPGAGDDGAAVAVLIETAKHWAKRKPTNSLIVLFNEGEEIGLVGASAFMQTIHSLSRCERSST